MTFSQLFDRWRPVVEVTARHDVIAFACRDVFVTAPVVWFNQASQVAAIGEDREYAVLGYRRVDLLGAGAVLADSGEVGEASEKFLRYGVAMAMRNHPLRSWLRPLVVYSEEGQLLTSGRSFQAARIAAFTALTRRVDIDSVRTPPSK